MIGQGTDLTGVLSLMQIQNSNINQLYKVIFALYADLHVANNIKFQEFTTHFNIFGQCHACSEGFSKALDAVRLCSNYVLLEKLLDSQILAAAEQLQLAIGHLELVIRESQARINPQFLVLNQGICIIEENLLRTIETLESILKRHSETHLQN